ncbi:MAG: hypothetical protein ACI9HK_005012 [Pirellulaceae bacterium]|jgi:hypothetical protein
MSNTLKTLAIFALTALAISPVYGQHHHIPDISGKYSTYSPEVCTITQNGDFIWLSSELPGVSHFKLYGTYGVQEYRRPDGLAVTRIGFHGSYGITFNDGRPPVKGTTSVFPAEEAGSFRVHFFELENDIRVEKHTHLITRTGPLKSNTGDFPPPPVYDSPSNTTRTTNRPSTPASSVAPRRNDQYNLLPATLLNDLGI